MRSLKKKLTVLLAMATLACSAATLASCAGSDFTPPAQADTTSDKVTSNGGFLVETGDYVYFINGAAEASADNTYGKVQKGALYRIAKSALKAKSYGAAECVVPSLFVAQNYDGGVFIYDNYVYFASPTNEKEKDGTVSTSWLSFKKVKLDGTSSKKEADKYLFRLSDNTVSYRFVKGADGVVYCMYVQSSNLYSFNTDTGVTTLLVKGAENYYFDTENLENGSVYYLMKVPTAMTADAGKFGYNQLYRVSPEATAVTNADKAAYTVKDGAGEYKEYAFDKASLVKKNADFDGGDIAQYPYVNLGRLVLDGRGGIDPQDEKTTFNDADENNGHASYTYAVLSYKGGRVLLTRKGSLSDDTPVYTFKDEQTKSGWNTVTANAEKLFRVADDSTNASASAIYYETGDNLAYLYVSNNYICRTEVSADGTLIEDGERLAETVASSATLWKTEGEYLYYYSSADAGNNLYRLKYDGAASAYRKNLLIGDEDNRDAEYSPAKIPAVQWNDSWYKPEFADNTLFYCNAQSFGSQSFDNRSRIPEYFADIDAAAKAAGHVSVISTGWDPGIFSLERVLGGAFIPGARAYGFYGLGEKGGLSMGHSDALRTIPGVKDARQFTHAIPEAIERVRRGENPAFEPGDMHTRECFVVLEEGADREAVTKTILSMPGYFAPYKTTVNFVSQQELDEKYKGFPHDGLAIAVGETGDRHAARVEYRCIWGSNPEATANVLVAHARAAARLAGENRSGAFTILDIPPAYFTTLSREELLKHWM